jgi:elongation factor Ts
MEIQANVVMELRQRTGAGMMDCKKALTETNCDFEKAVEFLRKKGLAAAAKKSGRTASEGSVASYIHAGGKIGVLVEINCETDFVARNEGFQGFCRDVAMHIAAANPLYVRAEEIPSALIEKEKEIFLAQLRQDPKNSGKPEQVLQKIIEGKIKKFTEESCLLTQSFVKNPDKTVGELTTDMIAKIGENISVRRFARFTLGEGIQTANAE